MEPTVEQLLAMCDPLPPTKVSEYLAWIPLLPLIGFAVNGLLGRWMHRSAHALVACSTVAFAFLLSCWAMLQLVGFPALDFLGLKVITDTCGAHDPGYATIPTLTHHVFEWIPVGTSSVGLTVQIDPLSGVMALIITGVGFLIHVYSVGYMAHDRSPARYFAYLNLFMAAMLLLVMADSLPLMFVGWEGVGLCSYLLIGFWYEDDANASAGKKAFIMNRIGDFGFLLGIFLLFAHTGALDFEGIAGARDKLTTPLFEGGDTTVAFVAACLLFLGAAGKSAQIPLYTWLPDAMAGPTPVSALIHAATMVTAGVYMVARMSFVYALSPGAMLLVTCIGVATALLAGLIALAQTDIKKVLAYSTVSQLGFMFAAVGAGAFWVGIFHLLTHAFFKACLFLGAGSVIHANDGEKDMRRLGGLGKWMPNTRWTFLIATAAIAGFPLLAGFLSKDMILWSVYSSATLFGMGSWLPSALWFLLLLGALLTAVYMTRLYVRIFHGPYRGTARVENQLHESPDVMTWPLWILAAGAIGIGYVGIGNVFLDTFSFGATHHGMVTGATGVVDYNALRFLLKPISAASSHLVGSRFGAQDVLYEEWMLVALSVLFVLGGIVWAALEYRDGKLPDLGKLEPAAKAAAKAFQVDDLYDFLVVRRVRQLADLLHTVIDEGVIDSFLVRGSAWVWRLAGLALSRLQNGRVQFYIFLMILSLATMMAWVFD